MHTNIGDEFTFVVEISRRIGEVSYNLIASIFAVSHVVYGDVESFLFKVKLLPKK